MAWLASLLLVSCGFLLGAAFSGFIVVLWIAQEPKRLGFIMRWTVDYLAKHNGGLYIKMYAALFDTRRASKCMVYVKPEDLAEAIGWYAVKLRPFPLHSGKGIADGCGESDQDSRSEP